MEPTFSTYHIDRAVWTSTPRICLLSRSQSQQTFNDSEFFRTSEGLEIIRKLAEKSDVLKLVENFVSGKLATMGLGWEDCRKINERLIYTSITGPSLSFWSRL